MARQEHPPPYRSPGEVLGANVLAARLIRGWSQDHLAERMAVALGIEWVQSSVSQIEAARRRVSAEELLALALVLDQSVAELVDPGGLDGRSGQGMVVGGVSLPSKTARAWLRGRLRLRANEDGSLSAEPTEGNEGAIVGIVDELRELRKPRKTTTDKRRATARQKGKS